MDRPIWVRLLAVLERNPESTTVTLNRASAEEMLREIARLRAGGCARDQGLTQYCAEAASFAELFAGARDALAEVNAENERLREVLEQVHARINEGHYEAAFAVARAALKEDHT